MTERYKCCECSEIVSEGEVLRAPSPFDATDILIGCPNCKSVDSFELLCDEPGCNNTVVCGWPSPQGYRRTCHQHSIWNRDEE